VTRLSAEPVTGAVRLVVVDHGPGVPEEEREKIFERFYRGNAARRRGATDGTGLGLSLVAEHVRLHGGRVWVESGPGGENRFVVELPATASQPVEVNRDSGPPQGGSPGESAPAFGGDSVSNGREARERDSTLEVR
jgi:signal transduction histidine kinase